MECTILSYSPFIVRFSCCGKEIIKHYDVALTPMEIFAEAESIEFPKEQSYKVTVETQILVMTHECKTFEDAKAMQILASALAQELGWTRQSVVDSIVEMQGHIFDLYNEGYIKVEPVE